ncbi:MULTISPECIES: cobalt transporter CbiM [unclassified Streptomyces]|jgi:cobalt/nickel transport system permease protein|uniref:cobalt transporter CbiM n=1 Tax=unclassified Streptomyces TaxID=2593676 RepID=UPI00034EBB86|nr:cobalt transporter CbiM [Streptomyces sp. HGB0020]EPD67244.1 cobalamin biosynthesis protein CbiM [Streptomyces sp. HGB0020]
MHIPDGYLSPQTCAVGYAVSVPVLAVAAVRVKRVVRNRHVPTLAVFSAVSFLAMMFNVPIPDGTTAHAVGAAVIAIVLGPWAAVLAVSVALAFQALLFGDGGVLSYGANVFNMAIVLPFSALAVYRLIAGRTELTSGRRVVAAAISGYVGINLAALAAAIEFGIQPSLFHDASGTPLYAPYHLSQTIPAMALAHLTVAGAAEAILTGGVVAYLQRANLPLLRLNHPGIPVTADETAAGGRRLRPVTIAAAAVGLMVVLTPLGLLAPGGAFGEDAPEDLDLSKVHLSAVPDGLNKYAGWWHHAIFDGYDFSNDAHPWVGYIISAVVGIAAIGVAIFLLGLVVQRLSRREADERTETGSSAVSAP